MPTLKLMDKLKSQTDHCLKLSKLGQRTTARTPTGKTSFRLTYRSEAVILAEVRLTSYRVDNHGERRNGEAIHL